MARSQVKTPRFYVDYINYMHHLGAVTFRMNPEINTYPVGLNPTKITSNTELNSEGKMFFHAEFDGKFRNNIPNQYFAILGHNCKDVNSPSGVKYDAGYPNHIELVNHNGYEIDAEGATYNGWSLVELTGNTGDITKLIFRFLPELDDGDVLTVNTLVWGSYYDMTAFPDLNLSMEMDYSGITTQTAKDGSDIRNIIWYQSPSWVGNAWELSENSQIPTPLARSGKRVWNLNFKFLDEGDILNEFENLNELNDDVWEVDSDKGIYIEDTFLSTVANKTLGGNLPFIFQPDNTDFSSDAFALCRIDGGFKISQIVQDVYSMNLKIVEI